MVDTKSHANSNLGQLSECGYCGLFLSTHCVKISPEALYHQTRSVVTISALKYFKCYRKNGCTTFIIDWKLVHQSCFHPLEGKRDGNNLTLYQLKKKLIKQHLPVSS